MGGFGGLSALRCSIVRNPAYVHSPNFGAFTWVLGFQPWRQFLRLLKRWLDGSGLPKHTRTLNTKPPAIAPGVLKQARIGWGLRVRDRNSRFSQSNRLCHTCLSRNTPALAALRGACTANSNLFLHRGLLPRAMRPSEPSRIHQNPGFFE